MNLKKFIAGIIAIPLMVGVLYIIPKIWQFSVWLIELDNTDFGFTWWEDMIISIGAGVLAHVITAVFIDEFSSSGATFENIIGIIVGFIISFVVHCLLRYWYILLAVGIALSLAFAIVMIVRKRKEEMKS